MLGDTAVAVNPKDGRYKKYKGEAVILPLMNREIPFIEDALVDPEFGTGVVKVTPAHDPADFEMGQRHNLAQISVIDEEGKITADGGPIVASTAKKPGNGFSRTWKLKAWLPAPSRWFTTSAIASVATLLWSRCCRRNGSPA